MKKTITFLATLCFVLTIQAGSPQKISYQAVIRNTKGALVTNQTIGIQISIYYFATKLQTKNVYVETQTPVTNENGLVSIEIGTGTVVSGVFADIDWAARLFYLKTEIDPGGRTSYTIISDTQILSVPYALHAKTVETGDNWGQQVVVTDATLEGNGTSTPLKIADGGVTSTKIADGTIVTADLNNNAVTSDKLATNSVTSSRIAVGAVIGDKIAQAGATTGQALKWNGSQWSPASDNTGNWTIDGSKCYNTTSSYVGIGNSNPLYNLDVTGRVNINKGSLTGNAKPLWYNNEDIILEVRHDIANNVKHFAWGGFDPNFGHIFDSPVGINMIPGNDNMLWVNGNATKPNGGSWSTMSDFRLKNVQGNYVKGLTEIVQLEPIWFTYKEGNEQQLPTSTQQTGFIAQEVLKVFPEAIREDSKGFLQFDMHPVLVSFVNGFKELKIENDKLKDENVQINARLEKLERLLLKNIQNKE